MSSLARWRWAALALAGCAPGAIGSSAALSEGIEDPGDPAVVAIVSVSDARALECTGAVIGERVVLTSAHCVQNGIAVFFGPRLGGDGATIAVLDAVAHPEFDDTADHDLGLLLLAEPAPAPALRLAAEPTLAEPPPVDVRLVGYGLTAADAGDDDRKREGRARTTEATDLHVVLGAAPSLPCRGDSGGPALVTTSDGERIGGVVSRGDALCTDRARATRVDVHREAFLDPWLDAWAPGGVAAGEDCLYEDHCAEGACVEAADEPRLRYCSPACASDADCARSLTCEAERCRYPLPTPRATGAPCDGREDCLSGECLDEPAVCTSRCVSGRGDCPAGFACAHRGGIDFFCVPVEEASGCAIGGSNAPVPGWLTVLAGWLWVRRRRR